ncbi:hypothetical protein AJ79_05209 [Helicocarpus griseus UAMH5409]|uniref:Uncharacterized protein n=1 Tax=Helicocarpus griseus UAMH5409 TaxID=1447875 RepID=A0A2B7XPD5_9EURO|nr:hypothetical protein AJ79_05209 [Helicocarpus griseus UAMH5409]
MQTVCSRVCRPSRVAASSQICKVNYRMGRQFLRGHKSSTQDAEQRKRNTAQEPALKPDSRHNPEKGQSAKSTAKTMAQMDQELRERLEERSGEGGVSALELEDGKPVAMKRPVRNNMFRYI